jgi:hypothetical protein
LWFRNCIGYWQIEYQKERLFRAGVANKIWIVWPNFTTRAWFLSEKESMGQMTPNGVNIGEDDCHMQ